MKDQDSSMEMLTYCLICTHGRGKGDQVKISRKRVTLAFPGEKKDSAMNGL